MAKRAPKQKPLPIARGRYRQFGLMCLLGVALLSLLFWQSFVPGQVLFSNDGPLGRLVCAAHAMPGILTGAWQDLNGIGYREGGAVPNLTYSLRLLLGPVGFAKFYAPIALVFLGLSAWWFFRRLGFAPFACAMGGAAAMLNSGFFSAACWGVASHPITIGATFLALGALVNLSSQSRAERWLRVALAGFAVGLAVSEGADIGAIFSVLAAVFILYQALTSEGPPVERLAGGLGQIIVVTVFAAFLATQTIVGLVHTQIEGVAGTAQDAGTREKRWDWATQFSLPKSEALTVIIPGLFGYRMGTRDGGAYWGAAGQDAAWERYFASGKEGSPPAGFLRFTGGGNYAGVAVVLLASWAGMQTLRRKDSVFSRAHCRWIWFWSAVALLSLLLAFGRYAPFYRLVYALPYASTVRNPAKLLHVMSFALVVLFGYGVDGLWRTYLQPAPLVESASKPAPPGWWRNAVAADRRWVYGCLAVLGLSLLGWMIYSGARLSLEHYLEWVQFEEATAQDIAAFSIRQVGWFVLFLAVAIGLLGLIVSGRLGGRRHKSGAALLALFLVVDLGRANLPWIIYWNYPQQYASNPVVELLRQRPYEHRVALLPRAFVSPELFARFHLPRQLLVEQQRFRDLYLGEWAQHLFFYYNIQSLDVVQMPRVPEDLAAYEKALDPTNATDFARLTLRKWQLTNTRYILGAADFLAFLNQELDPLQHRFRLAEQVEMVPKPGVLRPHLLSELTVVPSESGGDALFEFSGALPRVKLYTHWLIDTNDPAALKQLAAPAFDPDNTVLVAGAVPLPASTNSPVTGTVDFKQYAPKHIFLQADTAQPAILLLNDHFDPNWKVSVDGHSEPLLRCNYIMRGVYLSPGKHRIEFRFAPSCWPLYVSLAAVACALLLLSLRQLVLYHQRRASTRSLPEPRPHRTQRSPHLAQAPANNPIG